MNGIEQVLVILAKTFNKNNINWALGGSYLLYLKGYDVQVNDIDILVDEASHQRLLKAIKKYPYVYINSDERYKTEHFYALEINSVDIDIMINFKVKTKHGLYEFPFNEANIQDSILIQEETIYLSSVEEWLNAYKAMNRTDKVELIQQKNHFN